MFRSTAAALSEMILGNSSNDEEASTVAISSSLAVLDRLIEINQSAQVIEGFTAIVETISGCIPENFIMPMAQQSLTRIRRRLNIGTSLPLALPLALTQSTPQNLLSVTFELSQDLPGSLSNNGARHDNDHASIANIQILPTAQGTYGSDDIAVITPYLGQLQKIMKRLVNSFEIVVGLRDQEDLEAKGLQDAVYAAMAHDFRGTGHWYYCENDHPFTIGECGMPMETSQCPQCGSPVGGLNHQAVGGVRRATDLEDQFAGLRI